MFDHNGFWPAFKNYFFSKSVNSNVCKLVFLGVGVFLFENSYASSAALQDVAGITSGEFRVNESGNATYTIPIRLPEGISGLTPQLVLQYDSSAGNGHMGQGWNLGGLSIISRCPPAVEVEGYTSQKQTQFCLDGQKLIVSEGHAYGANGAEYRTEIYSFSKVVSYGSQGGYPTHFKIWKKDGSVTEYGNTNDSRIERHGTQKPTIWAVNKIQDNLQIDGNSILFSYEEDNAKGEFTIDQVSSAIPTEVIRDNSTKASSQFYLLQNRKL